MRVLILSCHTGEGHNSCAKAIKETVDAHGDAAVIEDALCFISQTVSRVISRGHVIVYRRFSRLFRAGYRFMEQHEKLFEENSRLYRFFGTGAEKLHAYIVQGGYDTVICTHPFAALMLSEMCKRYTVSLRTAFVATDYTCSPSVKESALERYCIPAKELAREFQCEHIPLHTIVASGIPIRRGFYRHTDKETAKQSVEVSPDCKHIVISCGSMGCGPMKALTGSLARAMQEDVEVTVICGTNDTLRRRLEKRYGGFSRVHIRGYVQDMSTMLDSADVYVTKAGGISVTEAAIKRLPMIFVDAVGGCEDHNCTFFVQHGCAVKGGSIQELTEQCLHILADKERHSAMVAGFEELSTQNAAECIYTMLKDGAEVSF